MSTKAGGAVRFRLAEVLEERRKAGRPMTQSELSRLARISPTTVNAMVLNKTRQVSLNTLEVLCAALGVEPGELLERERKGKRGK